MNISSSDRVLLAFYVDHIKDKPNPLVVQPVSIGVDADEFLSALESLEKDGFVRGIQFIHNHGCDGKPVDYQNEFNRVLTLQGFERVENVLGIDKDSPKEYKRERLLNVFTEDQLDKLKSPI